MAKDLLNQSKCLRIQPFKLQWQAYCERLGKSFLLIDVANKEYFMAWSYTKIFNFHVQGYHYKGSGEIKDTLNWLVPQFFPRGYINIVEFNKTDSKNFTMTQTVV